MDFEGTELVESYGTVNFAGSSDQTTTICDLTISASFLPFSSVQTIY
jgi:hypothetical protein